MTTTDSGPVGSDSSAGLGELPPLPTPAAYKVYCGEEYFDRLWDADQVRAYAAKQVAAERERWKARVKEAFCDGFYAPRTYNDTVLNTADGEWEEAKAGLLKLTRPP